MNVGQLYVEILGDTKPLHATLAGVRTTLANFRTPALKLGGAIGGAGLAGVQSLSSGLASTAKAATVGMLGLSGAAVVAVKDAADMEKAWSQVRKTTGLAGAEFEQLKSSIEGLSTSMAGVSVDELTDIAGMAGRLGIQGTEGITAYTEAIAKIRIALDDIPAEEAATSVARILNVFQLGPESALSFASALNKLDDTSTATARDILDITQRLSGTASTLGLSPQKVLALAAAVKDAGVENEVAGTSFSQLFSKLATEPAKFAEVAGKSVEDFGKTLRADPLQALQEFILGLKQFDSVSQFAVLDKIGLDGQRTAGSLLQLSQTIGGVKDNIATANEEWRTHASINKEVAIQGETTYAQLTKMGNSIKLLASDLGSIALPAVKGFADGVAGMASSVRSYTDDVKAALAGFGAVLAETFAPLANQVLAWLEPLRAAFLSVVDTVLFAGRNFKDIFELAKLDVADFAAFAAQRVTEFATYLMGEWPSLLADGLNAANTAFINYALNVQNVFTELYDYLTSMGQNPIEIKMKPLLEGFEGKAKAFTPGEFVSASEGLRKQLLQNIADRESARAGAGAGALAAAAGKGGEAKDKTAEAKGTKAAPTEEDARRATFTDLGSFAKALQTGAFGKDDAKKTADNTEKLVKETMEVKVAIRDQNRKTDLAVAAP